MRADLVLFPELALSGYPPEDLLLRPAFLADCQRRWSAWPPGVHGIVAVVGWPEAAGAVVFNAASVLRDGAIEQTYRKRELPNYAVFDERRYFSRRHAMPACSRCKGVQVGLVICEDLWFPEPLAATVALGAQLLVVPNASPFERGKSAQRDALLAQRVRESGLGIAYLNVVGGQDELVFDGASDLADGDGRLHPARGRVRGRAAGRRLRCRRRGSSRRVDWPAAARRTPRSAGLAGHRARHPRLLRQERLQATSGSACPAASIRRWCWRSRSRRWARRT